MSLRAVTVLSTALLLAAVGSVVFILTSPGENAAIEGKWRVDTTTLFQLNEYKGLPPETHQRLEETFAEMSFVFADGQLERRIGSAAYVVDCSLVKDGETQWIVKTTDKDGGEETLTARLTDNTLYFGDSVTVLPLRRAPPAGN